MENILLIVIFLVCLLTLALVFLFRSKKDATNDLLLKIEEITKSLNKVEFGFKEDFRNMREETGTALRSNRDELNNSVKDLKKELTDTLKTITDQISNNLKDVNKTLDEKLQLVLKQTKDNNLELRTELVNSLKGVQDNFDKNVE